jgi:hypothetical protein
MTLPVKPGEDEEWVEAGEYKLIIEGKGFKEELGFSVKENINEYE